jgi:hypothetical protein
MKSKPSTSPSIFSSVKPSTSSSLLSSIKPSKDTLAKTAKFGSEIANNPYAQMFAQMAANEASKRITKSVENKLGAENVQNPNLQALATMAKDTATTSVQNKLGIASHIGGYNNYMADLLPISNNLYKNLIIVYMNSLKYKKIYSKIF